MASLHAARSGHEGIAPKPTTGTEGIRVHPRSSAVRNSGFGLLLLVLIAAVVSGAADGLDVRDAIHARVATDVVPATIAGEPLRARAPLRIFYVERDGLPVWSDPRGVRPEARKTLDAIAAVDRDGLDPAHYHHGPLETLRARLSATREPSAADLADFDLLLTDGVLSLADHLRDGRIDARTGKERRAGAQTDLVTWLRGALEEEDVAGALDRLTTHDPAYTRLREALADMRAVAARGGWPEVPPAPTLRHGDQGETVVLLRRRLRASGDLAEDVAPEPDRFDASLEDAVRRFQRRQGLSSDGIVGPRTRAELAVPAAARARQIAVNLERLRWLPAERGVRHLLVNVAAFGLETVENGTAALDMRIIAGRCDWQTPVLSGEIREMILNPYWNVPASIARAEILPRVQRDPGFLARQRMRVIDGIRFRQDPGPGNPLGRIKFPFPNPYAIYLHDTPSRSLFEAESRAFSHGCIRLEKALELADWMLRDDPRWTPETLRAGVESGRTQTIRLRHPIPVYVTYLTAWVGRDGTLELRPDIYGRDAPLAAALLAARGPGALPG